MPLYGKLHEKSWSEKQTDETSHKWVGRHYHKGLKWMFSGMLRLEIRHPDDGSKRL
jgi:hypothetical protein